MKKPKKIRRGDIFVCANGKLRIIESIDLQWGGYHGVDQEGEDYFQPWLGCMFFIEDFAVGDRACAEYYLGNITDIKPEGK